MVCITDSLTSLNVEKNGFKELNLGFGDGGVLLLGAWLFRWFWRCRTSSPSSSGCTSP